MLCKINSLGLHGIEPYLVSVEVDSRRGLPGFDIVGLPDTTVKESRERVRSAIQNLGYPPPNSKLIANLAPAGTRKEGAVYDLPILLAVMGATGYENIDLADTAIIGEIGLSGELRGVTGVLPMVLGAHELGMRRVIVPAQNAAEASTATQVEVLCAQHTSQIIDWICGRSELDHAVQPPRREPDAAALLDFADVKGQEEAKLAMEVAAAGGHNLLLIGPPGTGKSMLARRLPSILPAMTTEENIEATKVHSVAGMLGENWGLLDSRPFRSPHHSVSAAALTGGGSYPRPGELSLAHNGVLFLDELPEFQKNVLEVLRQPLEDGIVSIARVAQRVTFPSRTMLVAAMNPCPCGFFGHPTTHCTCTPTAMQRYLGRVSGPLLDRIDIHIEVLPIDYNQITSSQRRESSAAIRQRVEAARAIQTARYKGSGIHSNAGLTPSMLEQYCLIEPAAQNMLKGAFDRLGLSARGYDRIRKLSRTVADLAGSETIAVPHIAQAIQLRSLDRKYWNQ